MESRFPTTASDRKEGAAATGGAADADVSPDQVRWDERFRSSAGPRLSEIRPWVAAQAHHLRGGLALDVACGPGRHSLWLARLGYEVDAVDVSAVALARLETSAAQAGLDESIHPIHADLTVWRPLPDAYDLVLVSLYWNRDLLPALQQAVRAGGLILYTTFHTDLLRTNREFSAAYLLQPGELISAFTGWEPLAFEERRWQDGGGRDDCTSSLLARRPRAV